MARQNISALYLSLSVHAYVFGRARESRVAISAVALFGCGAVIAALTNDLHHALYTGFDVVESSYGVKLIYHHGWLFWSIIASVYAALSSNVIVSL